MWGWLFGALFLVPGIGNVAATNVDDARELLGHTAHDRLDLHGPPAERLARSSS